MEAKDQVNDVIIDMKIHVTHECTRECNQDGSTPLICAAMNGQLPVVEYLVERGADLEAKDNVNDVIIDMKIHTPHMGVPVNVIRMDTLH